MSGLELVPVPIPATIHDDVDGLYRRVVAQRNFVAREQYGHDRAAITPEGLLPDWHDSHRETVAFLVRVDGGDAGRAMYVATLEPRARAAELNVELARWAESDTTRDGAMAALTAVAAERGRTLGQAWTVHRPGGGDMLPAPTGFGGVPADDPTTAWFVSRGWQLEQVERVSEFTFAGSEDAIAERRARAEAAAPDYRYLSWWGATPDDRLDQLALLHTRMSTDAPWGGMEFTEEVWDAHRVRESDARLAASGGERLTGAIEHIPSGTLVGFAELEHYGGDPDDAVTHQGDTLVLAEHRGHRLGMLLKTANIQLWRERYPHSPGIITYNAEENRPMLDVNEAVGFVPVNYIGSWQRELG